MSCVTGILAFSVDLGLRTLVREEMERTADASALAACEEIAIKGRNVSMADIQAEVAQRLAQNESTLQLNKPATLQSLRVGKWNTVDRTFKETALADADSVQVTLDRSPSAGNGVPTMMLRAFGVDAFSMNVTAIARLEQPPRYALVGLDSFKARGLLSVDGYPSVGNGSIASNGDVTLNLLGLIGVTWIDGHVATGGSVRLPAIAALTQIRDGTQALEEPLSLPPVSSKAATSVNNNGQIAALIDANGSLNVVGVAVIPAGTYCVKDFNVLLGALVKFQGKVTIFVTGNVNVVGTVLVLSGDPADLKIRVCGSGSVTLAAGITFAADFYAPQSDVVIAAGVFYHGRLIGKSIDILGTSFFFLRADLAAPELGRSRVALVR